MSKTSTEGVGLRRLSLHGPTMGSRWTVVTFVPPGCDSGVLQSELQAAVDRVDAQMSTWKPGSDLNRLNAAPVGSWITVPRELMTVLAASLEIEAASEGAFDIGVGDLVVAWGFGCERRSPDDAMIRSVAGPAIPPLRGLQLDHGAGRARKLAPLKLDLSGIAKGYGVDELGRVLTEARLTSWLAGIDGELKACGTKPDGSSWIVAHEAATPGRRDLAGVLALQDMAVATSGTYRHVVEHGGTPVSHTMDPRSRAPLAGDLASVTVMADSCMAADAWATAIMVAGSKRGMALASRFGLEAILIRTDWTVLGTL
ncbi:FAD:protein FMN transferase [Alsobacter sp. R-9]